MNAFLKAGTLCIAVLFFSVPQSSSAHATPIRYTPEAGATELTVPEEVSIHFSERVESSASGIKVFAEDGREVHASHASLDPSDPRIFSVPLDEGGAGVYTVTWQVVSVDDGHFTRGSYSFLVDSEGRAFEGNAGSVQVTYSTKMSEVVIAFVGLFGEALIIGALGVALVVLPSLARRNPATSRERQGVVALSAVLGALLLIVGSAFTILAKASDLANLRGEPLIATIETYLGSTGGFYTALKVLGGIGILATLLLWRRVGPLQRRTPLVLTVALVLGVIFFQSKLSHAAASFFYPHLSIAITAVHLLFKEILVGGVAVVSLLYITALRAGKSDRSLILAGYDALATIAVFFAGATGGYVTWLHLKRFDNLVATEWGERFIILLVLGAILGGLRVFHQFVLGARVGTSIKLATLAIATLSIEIVVASSMLFYSGFISMTTPPFIAEQYSYVQEASDDGVSIIFDAHPYESEKFRIRAIDVDSGAPFSVADVIVTAGNPENGIEANVIETDRRAENSFVFPMSALSPTGAWDVGVTVRRGGAFDANARFRLLYPDDVTVTKFSDSVRAFDDFAFVMLAVSSVLGIFGVALSLHAIHRFRRSTSARDQRTVGKWSALFAALVGTVVGLSIILAVLFATRFGEPAIKTACRTDGFSWQQAFPAREFEVTSPNSLAGCYMHDGHYHLVDYDEYRYVLEKEL